MGLVVLVTAAAPFAGANAGVAVWGVVAYGIAWAAMNGVRLSWRTAGLTLLAVVVAVAALAARRPAALERRREPPRTLRPRRPAR